MPPETGIEVIPDAFGFPFNGIARNVIAADGGRHLANTSDPIAKHVTPKRDEVGMHTNPSDEWPSSYVWSWRGPCPM